MHVDDCVQQFYLLDVPTQPTCMNGGYWELHQQLQSRLGARGQTGREPATSQRTTSERKLFLCQTSAASLDNCMYTVYKHALELCMLMIVYSTQCIMCVLSEWGEFIWIHIFIV